MGLAHWPVSVMLHGEGRSSKELQKPCAKSMHKLINDIFKMFSGTRGRQKSTDNIWQKCQCLLGLRGFKGMRSTGAHPRPLGNAWKLHFWKKCTVPFSTVTAGI